MVNNKFETPHINAEKIYGESVIPSSGLMVDFVVDINYPYNQLSSLVYRSDHHTLLIRAGKVDQVLPQLEDIINTQNSEDYKLVLKATHNGPFVCPVLISTGSDAFPFSTILAVKRPNYTHIEPSMAFHLKSPLTSRHKELLEAWNGPAHLEANSILQDLMEETEAYYASQKFIDLDPSLYTQDKPYITAVLDDIFEIFKGKFHPKLTEEGEISTHMMTFNKQVEEIIHENRNFLPQFYIKIFDVIKHKVHPWLDHEWDQALFNQVDWEHLKKQVPELAKGHNGLLGGSASSIDYDTFDIESDPDSGIHRFPLSQEWIENRNAHMRLINQSSRNMQNLIEALAPLYQDIVLINEPTPVRNGVQAFCPVAPHYQVPENGQHAFDILSHIAIRALEKCIQRMAA